MDHQQTPPGPARAGHTAAGRTGLGEAAVAKVAAAAALAVPGVHSLGAASSRAMGALRGAVAGAESVRGVSAEVGNREAAVDVVLTAEYGRPLPAIAADVRSAVYAAVEQLTGLSVIEVNVEIADVYVAGLAASPDRADLP